MTMPMAVFASKNRQTLGVCRFFESYYSAKLPNQGVTAQVCPSAS